MGINPPATVDLHGPPLLRRGKVRDVYDLHDKLLIVASDRISAFDEILPTPVPGKGKILTQAAQYWFERTKDLVPNHLITTNYDEILAAIPGGVKIDRDWFDGRMMLVRKAERIDAECVARGYLAGSGYNDYMMSSAICGHSLPPGLHEADILPQPIFTPATKAPEGHDQNISRAELARMLGAETAAELERLTLLIFGLAGAHMSARGLILADTKLEFGYIDGKIHLIDEILTPDSSRVWEASAWKPGSAPDGFDKQYVRNWLERSGWNKRPPAPELPAEVVEGTLSRYREFLRKVTG